MSLTNPVGQRKNKVIDLAALAFVAAVLGLTPLIVGMVHSAPAKGPDVNPSILIIFLTFLTTIVLTSLYAVGAMVMRRTKALDSPELLTQHGMDLLNVLSKLVAGLFLISGFVKLQDPIGFGYKLDDYWVFFSNKASWFPAAMMKPFSVPIAGFVSVAEVALGFALITGYKMRASAWFLLLMLLFFTVLTGLAAFTGELQDCGCFGDALKLEPWQTFAKDLLLLIPGMVIFLHRARIHPYYRTPMPGFATIGSFVIGTALSIYCFLHLELLDFRGAYKVGQDVCYNAMTPNEEGEIFAHDFSFPPGSSPVFCDRDFCKGTWLLVVMYDMEEHPIEHYDAAAALVAELKAQAPGIQVVGGTSTGPSARKKMDLKFVEDFCWNDFDQKVLRTIIRSSPGFVLVQEGIVQQKWHFNDMPTVQELRTKVGAAADVPVAMPEPALPVAPDSSKTDSMID